MATFILQRTAQDVVSTAGEFCDEADDPIAATLERAAVDPTLQRIPAGTYPVILRKLGDSRFDLHYSKMFGNDYRGIPQIIVPGRSFIEIHMGNWYRDTQGCVILGKSVRKNVVRGWYEIPPGESREGFLNAYQSILAALAIGPVTIDVKDIATDAAAIA